MLLALYYFSCCHLSLGCTHHGTYLSWIMVSLVLLVAAFWMEPILRFEIFAWHRVLFFFSLSLFPAEIQNFSYLKFEFQTAWTDILYLCSSEESHEEISDILLVLCVRQVDTSYFPVLSRSFCELQRNQYKTYIRSQQEPSRSNLFKQILRKFWISRWLRITVGINSRIGGGGFFQFDANSRADEERPHHHHDNKRNRPPTLCHPSKFSIQTKIMISNAAGHNIIVLAAAARNGKTPSTE